MKHTLIWFSCHLDRCRGLVHSRRSYAQVRWHLALFYFSPASGFPLNGSILRSPATQGHTVSVNGWWHPPVTQRNLWIFDCAHCIDRNAYAWGMVATYEGLSHHHPIIFVERQALAKSMREHNTFSLSSCSYMGRFIELVLMSSSDS